MAPSLDALLGSYQQAYNQAKAANESRYQQILAGYDTTVIPGYQARYDRGIQLLQGLGDTAKADTNRQYNQVQAQQAQNLVSRGLGNTTVTNAVARGVENDRARQLGAINEQIRQQQLNVSGQLSQDLLGAQQAKLGFMERRTDAYPDQGILAQLSSQYGAMQAAERARAAGSGGSVGQIGRGGDKGGGGGGSGGGGSGVISQGMLDQFAGGLNAYRNNSTTQIPGQLGRPTSFEPGAQSIWDQILGYQNGGLSGYQYDEAGGYPAPGQMDWQKAYQGSPPGSNPSSPNDPYGTYGSPAYSSAGSGAMPPGVSGAGAVAPGGDATDQWGGQTGSSLYGNADYSYNNGYWDYTGE